MYFLLKTGAATEVPYSKGLMLPPFPGVKAIAHDRDWGHVTGNLGSMMTGAQVLLAGRIALSLKQDDANELNMKAELVRRAFRLITAYAQEYVSDTDFDESNRAAVAWLNDMHQTVRQHIQANWRAVEALAQKIYKDQVSLNEVEAFAFIEEALKKP